MTQVEKFSTMDLSTLRSELLQSGLDSWQAADMLSTFLAGRGYGVSSHDARHAASRLEQAGCPVEHIQQELEQLALVM
ncbi:MAG TPA: hypothetical protein VGB94_00115 [Acidobacteriaceae bacterium]